MTTPAATESPESPEVAELASQLRLAVARLSRRIRQQAAVTGEELTASTQGALATIERLGPGHPRRARRGRAGAAAEHDPHRRPGSRSGGYVDPRRRPRRPAGGARRSSPTPVASCSARSRTRKDEYLARRIAELTDTERALLARALPLLERLQDDAQVASLRGTFQSLHIRNFRLFFVGQLISQCGTWMQTIALGWLVLHLSHNSGFAIGLAIALQFIPRCCSACGEA